MTRMIIGTLLALALAGCLGGSNEPPPVISAQPADVSVVSGATASFSVGASGTVDSYLWQRSPDNGITWNTLAGAQAATYTTPATTLADDGTLFRALVSGGGTTVTSSAARLGVTNVVAAPQILVQPAASSVQAPAPTTFTVTASGTAPAYQWQQSADGTTWAAVAGATTSTHDTGATSTAMSGTRFRVVISNAAGTVTSNAAELTVTAAPTAGVVPAFTVQPTSQTVTAGSAAQFSATVSGTQAPALQWQRSNDNGTTWADIGGATSSTHGTGPTTTGDSGARFRLNATNTAGSATSDVVVLTVEPAPQAPSITTQPQDVSVAEGATAAFTAAALGVPTPTLQWQVSGDNGASWNNIVGATNSTYSLAAASADNGRRFRMTAGNSAGTASSSAATLTVTPASGCGAVDTVVVDYSGSPTYGAFTEGALCADVTEHNLVRQVRAEERRNNFTEVLVIDYDATTRDVIRVSYYSGEMGGGTAWRCDPNPVFGPSCAANGIGFSAAGGSVSFAGTVLREFVTGETVTLSGAFTFPPRP